MRVARHWIIIGSTAALFGAIAAPGGGQAPAKSAVIVTEGTNMAAALSPDGRQIAIDLQGSLWILPAAGGTAKRITDLHLDARQPVWSPDGRRLAFQSYADGNWHIWTIAPDGSGLIELTIGAYDDREPHWSPDGRRIAFSSDRGGTYDVWEMALETDQLRQVTRDPANDFMPAYSPDGREIAFVSDRGGKQGIWATRDGAERSVAAPPGGTVGAPSWHPDGARVAFSVVADNQGRLMLGSDTIASGEDVFPFRAQWVSATEMLYTADGKIKRRALGSADAKVVEFSAELPIGVRSYTIRRRAFPPSGPQPVKGVMRPAVSPDGRRIAFAALGDLWLTRAVMDESSAKAGESSAKAGEGSAKAEHYERVTNDPFIETDPAWSLDGRFLAFASDRAGTMDIWVRDMQGGAERRITESAGAEMLPAWSPDGARLAYVSEAGELFIVDIASRAVKKLHDRIFDAGRPTWSPDGRTVVVGALRPYSSRFREGTNQLLAIAVDGGPDRYYPVAPHRSAGMREDYGPVWSPDGTAMAVIMEGALWVFPVRKTGEPAAPPRRLTSALANAPSWIGDSRKVFYQTPEGVEAVDIRDGRVTSIRSALTWTPKVARARTVVHAGRLIDGRGQPARANIDIVIEGNRIRQVEPHRTDLHTGKVVDASGATVMPGLIEMHAHLGKGYGEALGRIWLAYGITTVRNPASHPYEAIEDREAVEAGARVGPRVFTTGAPFDGTRIYYSGGLSLDGGAELPLELDRARALGFDLIKTYVRLPDVLQQRVIEYAHEHGMPVSSHEIYPAAAFGVDGVEHIRGTSRRGYSPKTTALSRTYRDVIEILAASRMTMTPTIGIQGGFQLLTLRDPSWMDDPRIKTLFPASVTAEPRALVERLKGSDVSLREVAVKPQRETVFNVTKAGGKVVAGTDSPIIPYGLALQMELEHYVAGGLTPLEAIRTATMNSAEALGAAADLGSIEPGKLADLAIVNGDPLADIRHARNIRTVIKDGEVYELEALLHGPSRRTGPSSARP